jgi:L-fuconolactonase
MNISRREFVQGSVAAAAASMVLASGTNADEGPMSPIIDCHQHLWDLRRFNLPWLTPGGVIGRSFVMSDYLAAIEGTGIKHAVYMEVDVAADQKQEEVDYIVEICRSGSTPTVSSVVGGNPSSESFREYASRLKGNPYVRGVRQVLHGGLKPGAALETAFVSHIRLLGELGLSFDLCMRPQDLGDAIKLTELCRDTFFILDHCGNGDPKAFLTAGQRGGKAPSHDKEEWKKHIAGLAERRNVVCKISGIVASAPEGWTAETLAPVVNHCLDSFGPDRVVFGSDWPVCLKGAKLSEWVAALREIISNRPAADQRKLLYDNAVRIYRLEDLINDNDQ